jgi:hypothetical protein
VGVFFLLLGLKLTLADHFQIYSSHQAGSLSTEEIKSTFLLMELASELVTISNFTIQIQPLHYLHVMKSLRISEN